MTVHVDILSFRPCAEVLLLKCGALMQSYIMYSKIASGTCSSNGFFPVTTFNECNVAAAAISNADTSATEALGTPRPEGCYDNDNQLWLATNTANIGNGADGSRFPICRHTAGTKFMDALSRLQ